MSREELQAIANQCSTYKEIGEKLGYEDISCPSMGKKVVEKYELDFVSKVQRTDNPSLNPRRFDTDYVQNIVNESYTFVEVARALGYKHQNKIPHLLDKLGIDYSHFDPNQHKYGTRHSLDELQENTTFTNKVLRELLCSIGKTSCEICSCENQWNEKEITLEVHHKNGNHHDNRVENLMLVCPTCHAYIEGKIGGLDKRSPNSFEYEILAERRHCCEECRNSEWKDGLIPLELHHIDGNHHNNTSENVKLLCPNCHSQTKTFGCQQYVKPISDEEYVAALRNSKTIQQAIILLGRAVSGSTYKRVRKLIKQYKILHLMPVDESNIHEIISEIIDNNNLSDVQSKWGLSISDIARIIFGQHPCSPDREYPLVNIQNLSDSEREIIASAKNAHHPIRQCIDCGKLIYHAGDRCSRCAIDYRKNDFPPKAILKEKIRKMSFLEIGKEYEVSGNAVVKWCKHHNLPWRKIDINSFTDEEWEALDVFSEDMKNPRILHDHDTIIKLLDTYCSAKYVSYLLNLPIDTINDVRKQRHYKRHMIEWSSTTCHLVGSDFYFRTTTDAGHWIAETVIEMQQIHKHKRGSVVKEAIDNQNDLYGYQFEYVKEEDYFDIIGNHEVISYAYQEHREVPPQVKK